MKKAIKNTRIITMGLIMVFIMGFTQVALSIDGNQNPVELKAIGNPNKQPLFELKVNNAVPGEFLVKVKDENGDLLYTEKLSGKNVSRTYQLGTNLEEINDVFNVRFEITSVKTHEVFIYNVTRKNHVVQDIIVAKL
ncbi:MAG: hypothetical protein JWO92_413 [Chitinophagaceae bacterium]|nr:hypothetical protein [Chitinophagaceae bacterium]MDB5222415.1 hypothetical protein [Chitinophagaceae bacterium]